LRPTEFGELQPYDFHELLDGYRWRQERQEAMSAYWVHCLMACQIKKPPTPAQLLKPLREPPRNKKQDEAELRKMFGNRLPGGE
jgi:hypothetical protein